MPGEQPDESVSSQRLRLATQADLLTRQSVTTQSAAVILAGMLGHPSAQPGSDEWVAEATERALRACERIADFAGLNGGRAG